MEYRYVVKSFINEVEINGKIFDKVEKVPLFSPYDIPKIYKRMLEKNLNVKILKRTAKGWIELKIKDVSKEIPRGHKKAYKINLEV